MVLEGNLPPVLLVSALSEHSRLLDVLITSDETIEVLVSKRGGLQTPTTEELIVVKWDLSSSLGQAVKFPLTLKLYDPGAVFLRHCHS